MNERPVGFVLSDYDGTLAPADVSRSLSAIPDGLDSVLREISRISKLAVITAKDFQFIAARVPYARAWGCVFGIDLHFADGSRITFSSGVDLEGALATAKETLGARVIFEEKRGASALLGFSIDWRGGPRPPEVPFLVSRFLEQGLHASYDSADPFLDLLSAPPMKGRALRFITATEGTEGATVYLGDSASDNSAFRAADISVGVAHGQALEDLECEYVTTGDGPVDFLRALAEGGMRFDPGMPGLRRK